MAWIVVGLLWGATVCACHCAEKTSEQESYTLEMKNFYGFRGNGTGVYPESHPPTEWVEYTMRQEKNPDPKARKGPTREVPDQPVNRNIRWRAALPNWGNGAPLPVAGRVFVACEPFWGSDWPVLYCFSATDGTLLWQRELNQLAVTGLRPEEQAKALATWREAARLNAEQWRNSYALNSASGEERKALEEKLRAEDRSFTSGTSYQAAKGFCSKTLREARQAVYKGASGAAGLCLDIYIESGATWGVGHVFSVPCSDGKNVYIVTGFHSFYCFDLDGNLKWVRFHPGQRSFGAACFHTCSDAHSPLLWRDLLISDVGAILRAFDVQTGELRWSLDLNARIGKGRTAKHCYGIMTPVVLRVGELDVLLCSGATGLSAVRLPDGRPLLIEGLTIGGSGLAVVNTDAPDTVFLSGGGNHSMWGNHPDKPLQPAAVKFARVGETLKGTLLWSGIEGKSCGSYTGLVYCKGRLYSAPAGSILDAATGAVVAGCRGDEVGSRKSSPNRAVPRDFHDGTWLTIAGGHVYGLGARMGAGSTIPQRVAGAIEVYTLDGKKVAENRLWTAEPTGDKLDQIIALDGLGHWIWFNQNGLLAVADDCLYVRSNDYLWCIGATKAATKPVSP